MRRSRGGQNRGPNITISRCGEIIVRGDNETIARNYETLSRNAADNMEAENFRQHAEHWRRVACGGVEVFS